MNADKRLLLPVILWLALCFTGCSMMIREEKATDSDPGNATALKLEGPKVKVVHNF